MPFASRNEDRLILSRTFGSCTLPVCEKQILACEVESVCGIIHKHGTHRLRRRLAHHLGVGQDSGGLRHFAKFTHRGTRLDEARTKQRHHRCPGRGSLRGRKVVERWVDEVEEVALEQRVMPGRIHDHQRCCDWRIRRCQARHQADLLGSSGHSTLDLDVISEAIPNKGEHGAPARGPTPWVDVGQVDIAEIVEILICCREISTVGRYTQWRRP
eukprot:2691720-Rhodomonas_salina.1